MYETLACGVPAIVTDFPGQRELVISAGCGIVIPPDDPSALAKAVREMSEKPKMAREMGRLGREAVVRDHSWQRRADDTGDAIRRAIARRAAHV
jgi:glycosyltransferase involved in cell wall biosynthesis